MNDFTGTKSNPRNPEKLIPCPESFSSKAQLGQHSRIHNTGSESNLHSGIYELCIPILYHRQLGENSWERCEMHLKEIMLDKTVFTKFMKGFILVKNSFKRLWCAGKILASSIIFVFCRNPLAQWFFLGMPSCIMMVQTMVQKYLFYHFFLKFPQGKGFSPVWVLPCPRAILLWEFFVTINPNKNEENGLSPVWSLSI